MDIKKHTTISIISGTLSLCICWFFWYPVWGILISLISTTLAIIAIVFGNKSKKFYKQHQESLSKDIYSNAKIGFNLGIIGLIISILCFTFSLLFTFMFKFLM